MVISLYGDAKGKEKIINELKKVYDNLLICNYFELSFKTIIEYQKKYYASLDSHFKKEIPKKLTEDFMIEIIKVITERQKEFCHYISNVVNCKMDEFLNNNKDKIIVVIDSDVGILSRYEFELEIFNKSDIRILVTSQFENYNSDISNFDNRKQFDYIINSDEKIEIKKLEKL